MTNSKAIELRNRIIELRAKHKSNEEAIAEFKRGASLIKNNARPVLELAINATGKAICERISKFCK